MMLSDLASVNPPQALPQEDFPSAWLDPCILGSLWDHLPIDWSDPFEDWAACLLLFTGWLEIRPISRAVK